ncbi:hypothetical protein [Algibacter lectus]|uniref:Lipoprotein n=1 Tax=Algibacter lectus TaxID=221126 RepID=A0A4R8M6N0_9FLAO|nr:hypothetical protein [Algibacter lectus]MWW25749.1 hypothetical protein [Algibacter lectus]TDY61030.1 hypothetical protein DFQ06_3041 [Algibacter lectus]
MKTITKFLILLIVVMLYSCNSMKSIAKIERQSLFKNEKTKALEPTLFTAHTDATQRISIIMADGNGKFITFSENPPDAALESAMTVFAKATVDGKTAGKVDAQTKVEFAKSIAELGKRSEAINFQRDGMFRLSELFNNGALTKAELAILIDSLQKRTVKIVELNVKNELETTKLKRLQEINSILKQADSTSAKPTSKELIKLLNE